MQIKNSDTVNVNFSSLSGYVDSTLYELTQVFGEPTYVDEDPHEKVQTEWCLRLNGVTATVYNWKTGSTPVGEYRWHVGGFGKGEVELVQQAIEQYRKSVSAMEKYMSD